MRRAVPEYLILISVEILDLAKLIRGISQTQSFLPFFWSCVARPRCLPAATLRATDGVIPASVVAKYLSRCKKDTNGFADSSLTQVEEGTQSDLMKGKSTTEFDASDRQQLASSGGKELRNERAEISSLPYSFSLFSPGRDRAYGGQIG